jgi:hypothetical protein
LQIRIESAAQRTAANNGSLSVADGHDSLQEHRGALTKPAQDQPLECVLRRIRGEYIEMPGLRLTTAQAQRLWGPDRAACDALMGALIDATFLVRTPGGAFVRS